VTVFIAHGLACFDYKVVQMQFRYFCFIKLCNILSKDEEKYLFH